MEQQERPRRRKGHMSFAAYVRERRRRKKIKFNDLVDALATSSASLTKYVQGKSIPNSDRMDLLAAKLDVDRVYLYALANRIEPNVAEMLVELLKDDPSGMKTLISRKYNRLNSDLLISNQITQQLG